MEGTYDATDCQEPDDDYHYFAQLLGIFSLHAIDSDCLEKLEADI